MNSDSVELWRERYLASLGDGDDRSIAKRLLPHAGGLADLLRLATEEVRGGPRRRLQLLRFIARFGDFGVDAMLTLIAEQACTLEEAVPA